MSLRAEFAELTHIGAYNNRYCIRNYYVEYTMIVKMGKFELSAINKLIDYFLNALLLILVAHFLNNML